jgi:hypothetical protein
MSTELLRSSLRTSEARSTALRLQVPKSAAKPRDDLLFSVPIAGRETKKSLSLVVSENSVDGATALVAQEEPTLTSKSAVTPRNCRPSAIPGVPAYNLHSAVKTALTFFWDVRDFVCRTGLLICQ